MRKAIALSLASALLAGCVGRGEKDIERDVVLAPAYLQSRTNGNRPVLSPSTAWWKNFRDPTLNALVEEALTQNLSVRQASERITAARLAARINRSNLLPRVSAQYEGTLSGSRRNGRTVVNNDQPIGLNGAWTIPFGGKMSVRADRAAVEIEQEGLNEARLNLIAEITSAYLDSLGLGAQIAIARRAVSVQQQTADITLARFEAGSANALDNSRAKASAASTSADIPGLEQQRQQTIHQIAILMGKEPSMLGNALKGAKRLHTPKLNFDAGIPADLLRNRPDIRAAERSLERAVATIGVREADLLPSITLSGNIRASGGGFATGSWNFGPSINLPIFDRGQLVASVDLAKSEARQQYLAYRETVIFAVGDVENAIVAFRQERIRRARLATAVTEYENAADLARQLYESGSVSFLDVLSAQASLYSAQQRLASSELQAANNYVVLCRALGGGWKPVSPSST